MIALTASLLVIFALGAGFAAFWWFLGKIEERQK